MNYEMGAGSFIEKWWVKVVESREINDKTYM
jgi:hypothetical protein